MAYLQLTISVLLLFLNSSSKTDLHTDLQKVLNDLVIGEALTFSPMALPIKFRSLFVLMSFKEYYPYSLWTGQATGLQVLLPLVAVHRNPQ